MMKLPKENGVELKYNACFGGLRGIRIVVSKRYSLRSLLDRIEIWIFPLELKAIEIVWISLLGFEMELEIVIKGKL